MKLLSAAPASGSSAVYSDFGRNTAVTPAAGSAETGGGHTEPDTPRRLSVKAPAAHHSWTKTA
jgi:hypothetical protein